MPHWRDKLTSRGDIIQQELIKENDGTYLRSTQNFQPILDENQRMRSQGQRPGTHGAIAARVPVYHHYVLWPQEFERRHGWHPKRPPPSVSRKDAEKLWRDFYVEKLHDRDYSKFRIDQRRFTANG